MAKKSKNENLKLLDQAEKWISEDPDLSTRAELQTLIQDEKWEELADRFQGFLKFGTAGLRGLLGAGPHRMNRLVVAKATVGVCKWVKEQHPNQNEHKLCVGYDGRHRSKEFAEEVASIAAGFGIRIFLFDHPVPTPVLAYSVLKMHADAGVTITASHNPPAYNGYKLYGKNGAQIIPPHDQIIAEKIDKVGHYSEIRRVPLEEASKQGFVTKLSEPFKQKYLSDISQVVSPSKESADLKVAYTPLHGVGKPYIEDAFKSLSHVEVSTVEIQANPDPDFPTVHFPNPEEEGAMDLVIEHAKDIDANLILANDPDADRLAVGAKNESGEFVALNGNEIGVLIANYILQKRATSSAKAMKPAGMLCTLVSSPLLSEMAKKHGVHWEPTLTGFKWIANRAIELEKEKGLEFLFGYEEALGYCVGPWVKDKDGISAAVLFAELATKLKQKGKTLFDELETIARTYGLFQSRLLSFRFPEMGGSAQIKKTMDSIRVDPPTSFGDLKVESFIDLMDSNPQDKSSYSALPQSDLLIFTLLGGHRVIIRPSGTEPKVKAYIDIKVDIEEGSGIETARKKGQSLLDTVEKNVRLLV